MGSRWESVFVACENDRLADITETARELLPCVLRGQLSLKAFPVGPNYSLECTGFRAGPVPLRGVLPDSLGTVLNGVPAQILQCSGQHVELPLAILASRIVGRATWMFFSDTLGEAAGVSFEQGRMASSFHASDSQDSSYEQTFLAAIAEFAPGIRHVDDELFKAVYTSAQPVTMLVSG